MNYNSTFKLELSEEANRKIHENPIDYNKQMSIIIKESRNNAKLDNCLFCDKKCSSYCNSHSIPQFVLRNISDNGLLFEPSTLMQLDILRNEVGINEAGTFRLICRDCDSRLFSDYENPDNYNNIPTQKMLAQISLKNSMLLIYRRLFEKEIYSQLNAKYGLPDSISDIKNMINELDLVDFKRCYKKATKAITKNSSEYFLCFYDTLDYTVPIAFQGKFALVLDMDQKIVNDIYCIDKNYHTTDIDICIFPFADKSVIFGFIEDGDRRYRNFYKGLRKMDKEDRLHLLSYIIFLYTEYYFISPKIDKSIFLNENLINVCKTTSTLSVSNPFVNPYDILRNDYDLKRYRDIPNILSEEYKIQ